MPPNDPIWKTISRAGPALVLLATAACSSEINMPSGPSDPEGQAGCQNTRDFFAQKAWPAVFGKTCLACHGPDGVAAEEGAAFHLLPTAWPGFIDANLASISQNALNQYDGVSMLLAKPGGLTDHGGGKLISEGDAAYQIIQELITRLEKGEECQTGPAEPDYQTAMLLGPQETFRKATLALTGRLPSDAEVARLEKDGEKALSPLLDKLLKEDAFFERLKEIYNDTFLTDRYYPGNDGVDLLDEQQYPRAGEWFNAQTDEMRSAINRAIAREPLELIAYIVKNDKPFSDVVTANYTVVNPYSAQLYDVSVGFSGNAETEWREAKLHVSTETGRAAVPHAGILTNPMWLNRFPNSETNRNRHRARKVMSQFLATDILRVAERPIDPLLAAQYNNPTLDDPSCTVCHRQLDPIAGAFMKWDDEDPDQFVPEREWFRDMFAPGYGDELMPVAEYDRAQRWLAKRVANDPRFALSVVRQMYTSLTGHAPLEYPVDGISGYSDQLKAWEAQERTFRGFTEAYLAAGENLKVVIRQIVLSPYFRTAELSEDPYEEEVAGLSQLGTAHLSIPEQLDRKINATVGFHWQRDWDRQPYLRGDYAILYGGIDSELVTTRLTDVNSIMVGVQWRMANEVACMAVPYDLSLPQSERLLFKNVLLETTPLANGLNDEAAILNIKKNIQYLQQRFWGTSPALDDPELLDTYQLFLETWQEGVLAVASGDVQSYLPWQCSGRRNPITGEDLPESQQIGEDPLYTVRAWTAVLTYLMADYQFLYE